MKAFLGLFLFSVFLATGAGLQCETCVASGDNCSGKKETCPSNSDACHHIVTEMKTGGLDVKTTLKGCGQKSECQRLRGEVGKVVSAQVMGLQAGSVVKSVVCSKASTTSASLLLALSGLLLMKSLF
ncbi:phospholipase A2 inhibitor gamma subunit B [Anolis carolinensis]|uniref:phospholipase A2 inhibitor gamma subunit B n=1 Tax=Anolis carolinensis TaxID=28377 RepID=UPI0002039987|nr:PREDICTED: phospholipase A2 inhibitor subunit gamma B [Anolis carolinensis]|eukprot:XP_003222865.1 PREDICTED: phospholipase A2 inhibitor subunit gamma B [Anolis carolinensis]